MSKFVTLKKKITSEAKNQLLYYTHNKLVINILIRLKINTKNFLHIPRYIPM